MSNFTPCTEIPSDMHPWWIQIAEGGLSPCIPGSPQYEAGCTLANCVGWSWGRYCQLAGEYIPELPHADAGLWFQLAEAAGLPTSQEPALGAVACYDGHVCNVEEIAPDRSWIRCSESDYGGAAFSYRTRYRANNWNISPIEGNFHGFILNPFINVVDVKMILMMKKRRKRRLNGRVRL